MYLAFDSGCESVFNSVVKMTINSLRNMEVNADLFSHVLALGLAMLSTESKTLYRNGASLCLSILKKLPKGSVKARAVRSLFFRLVDIHSQDLSLCVSLSKRLFFFLSPCGCPTLSVFLSVFLTLVLSSLSLSFLLSFVFPGHAQDALERYTGRWRGQHSQSPSTNAPRDYGRRSLQTDASPSVRVLRAGDAAGRRRDDHRHSRHSDGDRGGRGTGNLVSIDRRPRPSRGR